MKKKPVTVVVGIICRDNDILLGKQITGEDAGLYIFPRGKREWGETVSEALEREIKEEVGIEIKNARFREMFDRMTDTEHWLVMVFEIDKWIGEISTAAKENWTWYSGFKLPPIAQWNETLKMCREKKII